MVITDRKLLYYHGVAEGNVDKKLSTLEYNKRTVYDCFNNPFTYDFGSPALHPPPITIDDIIRLHKGARYNPYLIPASISVSLENSFSNLTTPSDFSDIPPYDYPNTLHAMKIDVPVQGRVHRRYCCRKYNKQYATK